MSGEPLVHEEVTSKQDLQASSDTAEVEVKPMDQEEAEADIVEEELLKEEVEDEEVEDEEVADLYAIEEDPMIAEIRKKQQAALAALKEKSESEMVDDPNSEIPFAERAALIKKARLNYLIEQTEVYRNIALTEGEKKRGRRSKKREQDEDAKLVEEADQDTVWLTQSPGYIKGGEMRDYQVQGLNWMLQLYNNGINGILADEMGLGKTLQTISLLGYLKNIRQISGPHLVIVPKSTLTNWKKEFTRWCPSLDVFVFHGTKDIRAAQKKEIKERKFDVVVTTYEIATIEKGILKRFSWRYIIIDEAHRIKNENSLLSKIVRVFKSHNRLLLTGTPLQNNLHELWALLNFLLPDIFNSASDFDELFEMDENNKNEMMEKLHKLLKPFLLRRLKTEVEKSLPPKKETKLYIGCTEMQKEWYKNIVSKNLDVINGVGGNRVRLLNILMQLRKCCNHPYLFHGAEPEPHSNGDHLITNSGKMILLDKLLARLKKNGSRVLIFSQMTRMLDILEDFLYLRNYQYCRIDGSTSTIDREQSIEQFNEPDSPVFVFLLSTRAGGLGINLATADTVILYDSDWNPQVDLQAQDRAHRIGQTKPVNVYRLVTNKTIEEKIIERAEAKLYLDALVIQQGRLLDRAKDKNVSKDELMGMIKFGADEIFKTKGSDITDADIDIILREGESKTEEINEKLKKNANSLLTFAQQDNDSQINVYQFMGVNYQTQKLKLAQAEDAEGKLPETRKRNKLFNESMNFADLFGTRKNKPSPLKKKKTILPQPKLPAMHEFQFYPERLREIYDKEMDIWRKRCEQKEQELKEEKEATTEGQKESKSAVDGDSKSASDTPKSESDPIPDLTEAELKEKERLTKRAFGNWTKKDYLAYVKACEFYGRNAFEAIAGDIRTKTADDVAKYSKVFWKKYKNLPDWRKIVNNIERGEKQIKRIDDMIQALRQKVASYTNPWKDLKISYGASRRAVKFTVEEDRFLLCMTDKVGYGRWLLVKQGVQDAWEHRFNWAFKSQPCEEIHKRVDFLIHKIEKEKSAPVKKKTEKVPEKKKEPAPKKERKPPTKRPPPQKPSGQPPRKKSKPNED